jgi:hypothetical protein
VESAKRGHGDESLQLIDFHRMPVIAKTDQANNILLSAFPQ